MKEYAFHELEAERRPKNGYVIVGSQVFRIDAGRLYDSWELSEVVTSDNVQQVIAEARMVSEMPRGTRIYVDLEGEFSPELSENCGRLLTPAEYYYEECLELEE